ncbi:MAG TPA: GGDEF domain-containing protein [Albitalea sp.]|nr:GGDEF domain-containing protein [Albitalea sp.]
MSLSVDDAVRLPRDLQFALIGITLVGIVVFAIGSVFTARRVTTPLRGLADAAERLGAGNYSTPMSGTQRHDEIGELSQSFERMRISVAENQAQILKLAYWDSLTGLPNRAQFRDAVHQAVDQAAPDTTVAIIMLDLNRFKHVNDVLGYRIGDLLLVEIAKRLTLHLVRDGDLVARLSGDEFGILLRDVDTRLALLVAQRIEQAFDAPLALEGHHVDMGAGIGIACWPQHADGGDALLNRAEVAMYAAKRRSTGPLLYDPSIDVASAQTLTLMTELRHAVDCGELRLYLQPKLALDNGRVIGAEALVRWQHPQRGLVPPVQFIPFAEQTGFIRVLTLWVFEEAARHWQTLNDAGIELSLSVNLSTRDLLDQELPQKFEALLAKHRVPATALCLEITESAIMDDPQRALATLDRLNAIGFKLSIDDFGTGYSSLAYLKRLPVDELKIDQSFVRNMQTDADDAMIVRSTIDLAHNLGISVVAEGVENAQVWNMLRQLDCDQAQGYHMGRPMPLAEFSNWSKGWSAGRNAKSEDCRHQLH